MVLDMQCRTLLKTRLTLLSPVSRKFSIRPILLHVAQKISEKLWRENLYMEEVLSRYI